MGLEEQLKILTKGVDEQLEFIKWLKSKGLYDYMESGYTMNKMFKVWKAVNKDK